MRWRGRRPVEAYLQFRVENYGRAISSSFIDAFEQFGGDRARIRDVKSDGRAVRSAGEKRRPRCMASIHRSAAARRCPRPGRSSGRDSRPRSRRPARGPARRRARRRLTRLDIVGWPKPMPNASGTSASANSADRMRERRRDEADGAEDEPEHERRLVAEPLHDRPDEPALDDRAEQAERREEIAGLRRRRTRSAARRTARTSSGRSRTQTSRRSRWRGCGGRPGRRSSSGR